MKVTLRRSHNWDQVKLVPEAASYDPEFEIEIPFEDVKEILVLQTQMEATQQKLLPLFKACEARAKLAVEHKQREEEAKLEAQEEALTEPSGLASV